MVDDEGSGQVSAWLSEQFGGEWMPWDEPVAGAAADGRLWARCRVDGEGRMVLVGLLLLADGITTAMLRQVPVGRLESAARDAALGSAGLAAELGRLRPLRREGLSAVAFSELVAEHYRVWARHSARPAAAMARAAEERSATVHGWIHEARGRGFLPRASRGKRVGG